MHATSARKLVTSLLIVLVGKLKIDPSTHTTIPLASLIDRPRTMSQRDMNQDPEGTRKMILMMTKIRSIIRSVKVLPQSLILVEETHTMPKPIWVKR